MTPLNRVTVASRVFCIAAILGLGLVARDLQVILSLVIISTAAMTAVYLTVTTPLATALVVTVEAVVTGLVIGLALPDGVVFLPYLVVLTLIAGISRGVVGVSAVVVVQFFTIALATTLWAPPNVSHEQLLSVLSPWLLTSIGAGLLGAWLRQSGKVPRPSDSGASYDAAHRLLTQLRGVARRLSSGLDPVTIAGEIRDAVIDAFPAAHAGVFVSTDTGVLSPMAFSDHGANEVLAPALPMVGDCRKQTEPSVYSGRDADDAFVAALPLRVGSRSIGVVLVQLAGYPPSELIEELMHRLVEHSLRLDTALTFDEVRTLATVEERSRLAREIHDGIAQEVASLGYLVDDLAATAESDGQRHGLDSLRKELTRVVSELRLSIFDLRSEVVRETGLGSALSEFVRQVGSRSTMTVHLSLDEGPARLRAETESELLRIAQEAITNARRHSGAENLWVDCEVRPPFARLQVRDDGAGLASGRTDSYGLRIMRERADRLDAQLIIESIHDREGNRRGTKVSVTLGQPPCAIPQSESGRLDVAV